MLTKKAYQAARQEAPKLQIQLLEGELTMCRSWYRGTVIGTRSIIAQTAWRPCCPLISSSSPPLWLSALTMLLLRLLAQRLPESHSVHTVGPVQNYRTSKLLFFAVKYTNCWHLLHWSFRARRCNMVRPSDQVSLKKRGRRAQSYVFRIGPALLLQ